MVSKVFKTTSPVLGSGLAGIALFLLGLFLYANYGSSEYEPEIHSKFYDEHYEKGFIEALDKTKSLTDGTRMEMYFTRLNIKTK